MHNFIGRQFIPEAPEAILADEHRHIEEMIETVCAIAEHDPKDTGELIRSIRELARMTKAHFRHEEMLMTRDHYPGALMHKRDHDYLLKGLAEFTASLADDTVRISSEFASGLRSWMTFHSRKFDDSFKAFHARGAASGIAPEEAVIARGTGSAFQPRC